MNWIERDSSPVRRAIIIGGVVIFHVVVITAVGQWKGWIPKIGPGLIHVTIVGDGTSPQPAIQPWRSQ